MAGKLVGIGAKLKQQPYLDLVRFYIITRLHSSRMHTARTLTVSQTCYWEGCLLPGGLLLGVCLLPGGCLLSGLSAPGGRCLLLGGWHPTMH